MSDHDAKDYQHQPGAFRRWVDARMDAHVTTRMDKMVDQYATLKDGTRDEGMAARIEWEMKRRWTQGKQLDILEPIRWAAFSTVASVGLGIAAKVVEAKAQGKEPPGKDVLLFGSIVAAVNSAVQLIRIVPRYDAGLRGAAETARAQYLAGQQNMNAYIHGDTGGKGVTGGEQPEAQTQRQWGSSVGSAAERNAQASKQTRG